MKTTDIKFYELCDEIDYWKEKASAAAIDVEYWKGEYSKQLHEGLISSQKGVANALMLALSVQDGADGSLILDKESRKKLADNYRERP